MKRLHIAVITLLGNGHVYPVLPLCAELVKRGHRVSYVTDAHYSPLISEAGGQPVVFKSNSLDKEVANKIEKAFRMQCDDVELWPLLRLGQKYQLAFAESMLLQVQPFYGAEPPDLILYDIYATGGRLLAHWVNCPAIRVSAHFAQYEHYFIRENGVFKSPPGAAEYRNDLDSFLLSHGIQTTHNLWHEEKLNIHLIPREFQYCKEYFDDRFCFAGALLNRPFKPRWKNKSAARPIILISDLSGLRDVNLKANSFLRILIESLAGIDLHCILSIGDHVDTHLLEGLPENFEVNRNASHLEILPHAALSICHGGMLSTLEAIYNGVPVLAIPSHFLAEEVAYRTVEIGAGRCISRSALTVETIRDTVQEMLQDISLHRRVAEIQDLFRRSGGSQLAANLIENSVL